MQPKGKQAIKYAALLRGINPMNVNMRNNKLREVFEMLGYKNVQTVINSGNVLFESDPEEIGNMETIIEKALKKQLGFFSTTIIRSEKDFNKLINKNPFKGFSDTTNSRLNVTFLKKNTNSKIKFPFSADDNSFKILGNFNGVICSVVNISTTKTPDLMLWIEKQFGKEITTRTWKTVHRIHNKFNK